LRTVRYAALLAAALLVVGAVAAADEKVTLRIEVPPKSLRGLQTASNRAILDAFLAKNPDVVIDPYVKLRISGPRGEATLYMAMAGDTAPDALYVYGRSTLKYIDQDFLWPLNEFIAWDNELLHDEVMKKFLPALSREMPLDDYIARFDVREPDRFRERMKHPDCALMRGDKEGNIKLIYGIPAIAAVSGLMYRKDLFAASGLDPERPPATWEELLDYARRLTLPDKGQKGLILPGSQGASWRFANFAWQAGGRMCRKREDGTWYLSVDEPEAIQALEFYREMRWGKWTRDGKELQQCLDIVTGSDLMTRFIEGRAAMTIISTTGDVGRYLQTLDPSQVGLAPLPAGPVQESGPMKGKRIRAAMLEGEFWGINSLIAGNRAKRDTTWRYIRFLISDEAKRIKTRVYVEAGWAIQVNPKWLEEYGYATELRQIPKGWVTLYDDLVKNTELEPYARAYAQVSTGVLSRLDEVLFNEKGDPATVMRSIAQEANEQYFMTTSARTLTVRRYIANGVAAVLGAGVLLLLWRLVTKWRQRRREQAELRSELLTGAVTPGRVAIRRRMEIVAWLFMLPAVLTILIWKYYPLVRGAWLAFTDYRIIAESAFVWLDNFIEALVSKPFWIAFLQTVVYACLALGFGFLMPIILALMLSEIPRAKMFFRTVFYLPAITSGLVVMFIWKMMYDGSDRGIFNIGLKYLTGTTMGRITIFAIFLGIWMLVLSLVLGVIVRILHHYRGSKTWLALVFLAVAAPFWATSLGEIATFGDIPQSMTHVNVLETFNLSMPVLFGLSAALRAAVVLITAAGLLMLLRHNERWPKGAVFFTAAGTMLLMAAAMGLRLNHLLSPMDKPYPWLQDPSGAWAMLWVIVPGIWAGMGPGCIIYLAALKSIPEDLYEAADVDGAGPLEKAYHVTFQYLKPLVIINFVGAFVGTFHAMQNILVMTGGGPGNKTMTIGMDIFFNAFTYLKFGYATAEAWILGSLLIGFTLYQLRILKKLRFTRAEN